VKPDVLGGIYRVRKIGSHKTREKPAAVSLSRHYLTALNRDPAGFDAALRDLNHPILHIRRQAAEALGRISGKRAVPELLRSLADPDHDRVLQHTLTYALIEIGDVDGTRAGLSSTNPRVKCAVLAALHAMPNGIRSGDVIPLVSETRKTDLRLRETAWWILIRHPEWAPELTGFIPNRLAEQFDDDGTTIRNLGTLTQHPAVQSIVADILQNPKSSMTAIQNAARVMDASPLKQTPESWFAAMTAALKRMPQSGEIHTQLLRVCSRLKPGSKQYPQPFVDALLAFGGDEQLSVSTRLSGLAALPANQISINSSTLSLVLTTIEHKDNAHVGLAWEALQRIRIEDNQWPQVVRLAASLSAVEMPRFVNLFDRTRSETTGLMLLKLLNSPEILSKLRVDFLKPVLDKYPESVRKNAASLYAVLDRARAGDVQKFESLLKELPPGDIRRGQVVFHSQKANCKACHTIGYVGGKIGPDLTRIGSIRTERDLLESIVFPSASFVRSYEPVKVETTDGRTLNGNVKSDQADELVLTIAADQEVRIARKDIESVQPGTISVMPSGLDQQMSKQELADLVAFLKANK
jgi:putative heme-binding domain-containing protein